MWLNKQRLTYGMNDWYVVDGIASPVTFCRVLVDVADASVVAVAPASTIHLGLLLLLFF